MITPPVALGTWAWGDSGESGNGYFGSSLTQAGLAEAADKAHSVGLTLWDTAIIYGMGRSETTLGGVLKKYSRRDYQISTKFNPRIAGAGLNQMAEMLEQSLKNLGTDYIDLYWIHNAADVPRWTPDLIPLLKSGKVKHVGVSNHNLREIKMADEILAEAGYRVEGIQNHYSLLYRSSEQAGILDYCHDHGISFFAYMVLEQGALTGKYSPENPLPHGSIRAKIYNGMLAQLRDLTEKLAAIGQSHGATASDVAIAWAIAKGTTPIVGITKSHHIDGLVRAKGIVLTSEEIAELETLADAANVNTRGVWEREM
ncbi:aldo/keto reductase [Agrobacterium salinitolerans]|uniref:aldo/keto reductase n=1 Tax=Agrobacterium salinitolerans TaxID=1183413 RepID=UPI001FD9622B|nr:aldo/keto reductase [Agrobacterium salinitolerans]